MASMGTPVRRLSPHGQASVISTRSVDLPDGVPIVPAYTTPVFVTQKTRSSRAVSVIAYQDDSPDGPTYFIPQPNNVTFRRGQTAVLQCSVENLGKKYVIWRKASEPHPISVGEQMFSPDSRYNVSFSRERREFNLLIRNVKMSDSGVYECQVSSRNKIIRHILLKVNATSFGKPLRTDDTRPQKLPPYEMPDILVSGKEFVNSGQPIRLVCNISGVTDIPQDLDWFKDGNLLRPFGRKIIISKDSSIAKKKLDSVLEIRHSKLEDSGTYVCRSSELLIASQRVIVLNEEKSNTGKRGTAGDAKSGQMCNKRWWALFISVVVVSVLTSCISSIT